MPAVELQHQKGAACFLEAYEPGLKQCRTRKVVGLAANQDASETPNPHRMTEEVWPPGHVAAEPRGDGQVAGSDEQVYSQRLLWLAQKYVGSAWAHPLSRIEADRDPQGGWCTAQKMKPDAEGARTGLAPCIRTDEVGQTETVRRVHSD
jgi:hypothetical protein